MKLNSIAEQGYNLRGMNLYMRYTLSALGFVFSTLGLFIQLFRVCPLATAKFVGKFILYVAIIGLLGYFGGMLV